MSTKRQTAANRRNARKSTGPKTRPGKATASMNALHHGLRARTVVLPGENREDFVAGAPRRVCVQQLHPDRVQPLRHHREDGAHQSEPEGIVLLAGVAEARTIEG